jgi:hypothetical protein
MATLKTTLEIPKALFSELKISAARQGTTIRALVNQAIAEKLRRRPSPFAAEPPWNKAFGGMRHLHRETVRIDKVIAEEFSKIDGEDWE